jgi:hypothetical protein
LKQTREARVSARNATPTYVASLTDSTFFPSLELEQAQARLREAIENGRELVRQSRILIELSETDGPPAANDNDCQLTN